MNPIERAIRKVDATQRRFTPTAFVYGVVKKYGDDNGGVLVSNLAYSAFVSMFPLLLVLVTILGLASAVDASFRQDVLNTVANQAPVLGKQLTGNVHELKRSSIIGLIVGLVGLLWGTTGLAQAGLFTMEQVWNLPGPARPGFAQRLGRALLFISLLGAGVIGTTLLASLDTFGHHALVIVILAEVLAFAVNIGMYLGAFRVLTPKGVPSQRLVPGAVVGGIAWTLLQILGTYLVHHFLHSDSAYGIFATVLGLLAWIYLATEITVYSAEVNVVVARRLWPRSIIQPPLTEADRASMAMQALQNQRRKEQIIEVTFDDRKPGVSAPRSTPQTPDEVAPPGTPRHRRRLRGRKNAADDAGATAADAADSAGPATDAGEATGATGATDAGEPAGTRDGAG
jgi:YihY family inner membrane protein